MLHFPEIPTVDHVDKGIDFSVQLVPVSLFEDGVTWSDVIARCEEQLVVGGREGFAVWADDDLMERVTTRGFLGMGEPRMAKPKAVERMFESYRDEMRSYYVRVVGDGFDGIVSTGVAQAPVLALNYLLLLVDTLTNKIDGSNLPFLWAWVYGRAAGTPATQAKLSSRC